MKRGPLKPGRFKNRGTSIKRNARLIGSTAPKKRGGRRFPGRSVPAYLAWIRKQKCVASILDPNGCSGRIEADHTITLGAGGHDRQAWPACNRHHRIRHTVGIETFARDYVGRAPEIVVAELNARYDERKVA